ncbi:hypothetical protein BDF20DRAFT_816623 [Mycotypha africana]|uniref:uncharacterized protein n=1 Tax=Mycotypha africana TaxID=64632 RepID=UPI002301A77E|nr:uncharacterized protein BDF20DRAFT_816623 [Mycotypha africana]KAI8984101.1 hypothetical protein BDF20DRAFT_816623 [Mycotypha africana]
MINTAICKICFVLFTLFTVALCIAKSEAEIEQPKTLRGGILRKSENCKHKVSGNSKVKLHYRARVWGSDEFYDNTYLANEPLQFKLGEILVY